MLIPRTMPGRAEPPFKVEERELESGIVELRISGRLDPQAAIVLRYHLVRCLDRKKVRILVDFSGVRYVISKAVSVLLDCTEMARRAGGAVVLAGVSVKIRHIFELMQLDRALQLADTKDEALRILRS